MNNDFDDFSDLIIKNIKKDSPSPFKLTQLKLIYNHFDSGDREIGMPIQTSLEIKSEYDLKTQKLRWKQVISHLHYSLNGTYDNSIHTYCTELTNFEIIKELEKYDLSKLKNNYFTDIAPEQFSFWEIEYNYYFKIVGTFDNAIEEYKQLASLLNFQQEIRNECEKITNKIKENKN